MFFTKFVSGSHIHHPDTVYHIIARNYTVLLRITGITKDKASFQAVSLFTTAGFTTSESEIITGDKSRRAIAKSAMVTGYFFSVVIVSLVINMFLSIDFSNIEKYISIIVQITIPEEVEDMSEVVQL